MSEAPRLDDQVCFALYSASRLLTRAYRPLLAPLEITYPQYLTLLVLWELRDNDEPPPGVKDLGARLLLDSGTLTPLLKRMEKQGLVERARDTSDERSVRVLLTEQGSALSEQASHIPQQLLCGAEPSELRDLAELRDAVRDLVERLRA